jgi:hypothetical protein
LESGIQSCSLRAASRSTAPRARILAEREPQRLDRWIVRAASCTQAAELFADD